MSIEEHAILVIDRELDRVAQVILGELKAECPVRSGEARASIGITRVSDYVRSVGGTNSHLYFADQGNNQRLRTILPVRAQALRFTDGTYHPSASTYSGKHFFRAVANRHR